MRDKLFAYRPGRLPTLAIRTNRMPDPRQVYRSRHRNSSSLPRTRHDHVRGHIARRYVRKLDPVSVSAQITTLLRLHYRNRGRLCAATANVRMCARLLYSLGAFLSKFLGRKSTSDNTSRTGSRTITIRSSLSVCVSRKIRSYTRVSMRSYAFRTHRESNTSYVEKEHLGPE